jgi:hypothetical protein
MTSGVPRKEKKRTEESQRGHAGLDSMVCIHVEDVLAASRAGKFICDRLKIVTLRL